MVMRNNHRIIEQGLFGWVIVEETLTDNSHVYNVERDDTSIGCVDKDHAYKLLAACEEHAI
jgi:hypothetical protein